MGTAKRRQAGIACVLSAFLAFSKRVHSWTIQGPIYQRRGLVTMARDRPRIVVIGGGASGFMGAIEAGRTAGAGTLEGEKAEVIILEGGRQVLQKVKISGGGRCNVMHDKRKPLDEILKAYPRGNRELLGPYKSTFGPSDAYRWFESEGVELKVEADGRVFPATDDSATIMDCLTRAASKAGVQVRTGCKVRSVVREEGRLIVNVEQKGGDVTTLACDRVLLATGASLEGHRLARELGHTLVDPVPSLFTLDVKGDAFTVDMAGVVAKDVQVSLLDPPVEVLKAMGLRSKKQLPWTRGPLLFTHTGLSGPAVLKLSSFAARGFHHLKYAAEIVIDWAPTYTLEELGEKLERAKAAHPKKSVSTFCPLGVPGEEALLPRRLWCKLVQAAGLGSGDEDKAGITWGSLTIKQLRALQGVVHATKLKTSGKGTFKEEFVTAGGVSLKEVDMKTMASKLVPGLHFAGEVLDIDAITGGYNFQGCWTTGWTAGRAIGQALIQEGEKGEVAQ